MKTSIVTPGHGLKDEHHGHYSQHVAVGKVAPIAKLQNKGRRG